MSENKSSDGIGFTGCLTIAFIVLKLCDVITWSWWWVLSLMWIGLAIVLPILGAVWAYNYFKGKNEEKKIVTRNGELKSKWEQRLEEMRERQRQMEESGK